MQTLRVEDKGASSTVAESLRSGAVAIVPTDTVYGLAAVPDQPEAVRGIYEAKGRPSTMHLPVMATSLDDVGRLGLAFSPAASVLAARWWPGPLTMVLGFTPGADRPEWLRERDEVAVRIPQHSFLLAVMRLTGVLLVTSANQHGAVTAPSAEETARDLGPHVSLIVDGGTLTATPSTVVNLRTGHPVIEREGSIPASAIDQTLAGDS